MAFDLALPPPPLRFRSGAIDKKELRQAVKALQLDFIATDAEIDLVFNDFDADGSGMISYKVALHLPSLSSFPPFLLSSYPSTLLLPCTLNLLPSVTSILLALRSSPLT